MNCSSTVPKKTCVDDKTRKPSAIAVECHSSLILEELSTLIDKECSQDQWGGTRNARKPGKEHINSTEDATVNQEIGYRQSRNNSELSLDSILEDETISIVRKREARIVDREVRSGSRLFRSRSDAAFARTGSLLARVICLASSQLLNAGSSDPPRDAGPGDFVAGKNATFHNRLAAGIGGADSSPNARASDDGHDLLEDFTPRSRCGNCGSRAKVGVTTITDADAADGQPNPLQGVAKQHQLHEASE